MRAAVRLAPFGLALLAGLLQAASLAWPGTGQPLWWLQLVSLGLFAWLLRGEASAWRGALLGWAFATAWLAGVFWWLYISLHLYGGLHSLLACGAVLGLAAFLGLYYAGAAGLFVRAGARGLPAVALFAALWLGAELARVSWFTGFPWGAGGYAHVDGPLAALAPWIGVHGLGMLAAAMVGAVAFALRSNGWRSLRPVALASGCAAALALVNLTANPFGDAASTAGPLKVALLQGNIPQDEKFQGGTGIPLALNWYAEQLRVSGASLVVAPETAIPLLPMQLPDGYLANLQSMFAPGGRAALVGIPLGDLNLGYTNSVLGWKPGDTSYRYDKHHLVPFGEFIPPLFRWFTDLMNIPLGDFNRGDVGQPSFRWKGQRLAPNICYEDLFGEELGARFQDPASAPTMFVNFSNIGWFGDSLAIDQHLQISRMRSLEFARPMLRATNTGPTVIIDAQGKVTHALPRLTRGVLTGEAQGQTVITPYAWWVSRLGLWPFWVLVLAAVGSALRRPSAPAAPGGVR